MTSTLFEYPEKAYYGKKIPKHKLYEIGKISNGLRYKFVEQIEKITWEYKLSPETINLPSTKFVPEMQVIFISLKKIDFSRDILRHIDESIPYPTLFEISYQDVVMASITYKRPSESDKQKWVADNHYYESDWLQSRVERQPLPAVLNLENMYHHILNFYMQGIQREGEQFKDYVSRMTSIRLKEQELQKLETRMNNEKQFNRKLEINNQVRLLKAEIATLK